MPQRGARPKRRRSRDGEAEPSPLANLTRIRLDEPRPRRNSLLTRIFLAAVVSGELSIGAWVHLPLAGAVLVWAVLATLLVIWAVRSLEPTEAVVGADGVSMRTRRGKRFFPLDRIVFIDRAEAGIEVVLDRGERCTVAIDADLSPAQVDALGVCIEQARAARAGAPPPPRVARRLERGGRSLPAWREELRRLASAGTDYRHDALSAEDVAAVLESPGASVEQRIGAALALVEGGCAEERPRIRIAAQASVDEATARALTAIAESDDAALVEALESTLADVRKKVGPDP